MSTEHTRMGHHALTLEDYKALNPTRPITDAPIGALTNARRDTDAFTSALFTDPSRYGPDQLKAIRAAKARQAGLAEGQRLRGLVKNAAYRERQRNLRNGNT
jgi:hypothetical protein